MQLLRKLGGALFSYSKLNHYCSRALQEAAFRTGMPLGRPTSVIVLLTNRCNARCLHCYSWKVPPSDGEMTASEWEKVLDELRGWLGPAFISMTGGETLVRKDSIGLARYASKLGFWVEFLTNGSLMTREGAEQLIRSGVRRIKISLDGSKAEIHDAVRGRDGFFERAREALEVLALKKSRYGANTQIWGKTTVMNLNAEDLPAIVALARALKIDGVEFQALEPTYYSEQLRNPHWHEENPLWVKDLPKLSESLRQVKELKRQGYSVLNTLENLEMIENYFYDPQGVSYKVHSHDYRKKEPRCTAWPGGLQISPEGGMRMCHWMEPFAWSRDGDFKTAWRKRDRCWKKDCSYIHPIALKEGKLDERDRQENPLHLRGGAGKHGHTRTNR